MSRPRFLIFAGVLLFLIGIFSGLAAQQFHNPRLAVSGHLEGVLNGMFLMIVGLFWHRLKLSAGQQRAAMGLVLFGTWANWALTLLGAAFGTKRFTPIAGAGYDAADWQELVVNGGLVVMILAMVSGVSMLLYGLRGADDPA